MTFDDIWRKVGFEGNSRLVRCDLQRWAAAGLSWKTPSRLMHVARLFGIFRSENNANVHHMQTDWTGPGAQHREGAQLAPPSVSDARRKSQREACGIWM